MNKFGPDFQKNLQFWLLAAVYIWSLEFQAIIALDDLEPLLDRIIDCSAILLTFAFWAIVASLTVTTTARIVARSNGVRFSRPCCKGFIIVASGMFFARWLDNWMVLAVHRMAVTAILICCSVVLALTISLKGKHKPKKELQSSISLEECFRFLAVPILICAFVLVVFQIMAYSLRGNGDSIAARPFPPKAIQDKPNILLIVADGLRPQNMSVYGYRRRTTPRLEKFAKRAHVYDRAYSNVTSTQPSFTTILTGKHPLTHGRTSRYQRPYSSDQNLIKILVEHGYTTAAVAAVWDASFPALGFARYLSIPQVKNFQLRSLHPLEEFGIPATKAGNRMRDDLYGQIRYWLGLPTTLQSYAPAEANLQIVSNLLSRLSSPFFIVIHVIEPHEPYVYDPRFKGLYSSKDSARLAQKRLPFYSFYRSEDQLIVDAYKDRYDETIRYLDNAMGGFLDSLNREEWRNNSLVIFTADHGESFEHNYLGHGEDLHEPSIRVPLIIHWPSRQDHKRIADPVQLTDIAPTILRTAGVSVPSWMNGQALDPEQAVREVPIVSIDHPFPYGKDVPKQPNQISIHSQGNKMIVDCETGRVRLLDVLNDSDETYNLAGQYPQTVNDLTEQLQLYLKKVSGLQCTPVD